MATDTPTLVCFPFAGAGASFFNQWQPQLDNYARVVPIELPGRERRIAESSFDDANRAADEIAATLSEGLQGQSVVLFGHCFLGAILAFEVSRRLASNADINLEHLIVSAARAPQHARSYGVDHLDDEAFIQMVKSLTGYDHPALDIPEIRELLIPALRADFKLDEGYSFAGAERLDVPIAVIIAKDDQVVEPDLVRQWSQRTVAATSFHEVEGGHMYLASDPARVLQVIREVLQTKRGQGVSNGAA